MNKALIWVGVLVVIVIVVVLLAGGKDEKVAGGPAQPGPKGVVPEMPEMEPQHMTYDLMAKQWANAEGPVNQSYTLRDLDRRFVYGVGTVVSAEVDETGGWFVELDVDPEKGDGADVFLETLPEEVEGVALVTVGEEYRFYGRIVENSGEGDAMELDLNKGLVSK